MYPGRWGRDGRDAELLRTIRELYSYVRAHIAAAKMQRTGIVIHLAHETVTDDDAAEPPNEAAVVPPPLPGRVRATASAPTSPKTTPWSQSSTLVNTRWGGYQLFCQLEGDALVSASNAFVLEVKKRRFFADFLQNVDPATLRTALLARRAKLAKKHGKPVPVEPTLEACVAVWEGHFARLQISARE